MPCLVHFHSRIRLAKKFVCVYFIYGAGHILSTVYNCSKPGNQQAKISFLRTSFIISLSSSLMTFFSNSHINLSSQSYNFNCTTYLIQLQFPFYNSRKLTQLTVRICPALWRIKLRGEIKQFAHFNFHWHLNVHDVLGK